MLVAGGRAGCLHISCRLTERERTCVIQGHKHILPHVVEALQYGRSFIPDYIDDRKLDQVTEAANIETWGHIFEYERFRTTVDEANQFKNELIIMESGKLAKATRGHYTALLQEQFETTNPTQSDLRRTMLTHKANTQVNHWVVEDQERQHLVDEFKGIVDRVAFALAERLYADYVEQLVALLNSRLCPEEPYVFTTGLQLRQCQWELRALVRRVASPIIHATLRWPPVNERPRKGAANDLARALPWEYVQVCRSPESTKNVPNLSSLLQTLVLAGAAGAAGAPYAAQLGALIDTLGK